METPALPETPPANFAAEIAAAASSTDLDRASELTPIRAAPDDEASNRRMNKSADPSQPYRGLIAGYTDAIRASDFKANIAILFVAFMMGPISAITLTFPATCRFLSSCCRS